MKYWIKDETMNLFRAVKGWRCFCSILDKYTCSSHGIDASNSWNSFI